MRLVYQYHGGRAPHLQPPKTAHFCLQFKTFAWTLPGNHYGTLVCSVCKWLQTGPQNVTRWLHAVARGFSKKRCVA